MVSLTVWGAASEYERRTINELFAQIGKVHSMETSH